MRTFVNAFRLALTTVLVSALQGAGAMAAPLAATAMTCSQPGLPTDATCHRLRVPEARAQPSGASVELAIVRLPAMAPSGRQAIFVFQGGPGQAATRLASFYARIYAGARASHDIVLVDQRGTGASAPFTCEAGPDAVLADLFDPVLVTACRDRLAAQHDLTQFTTTAAVADAEAVRAALGYDRIDLFGTSYGTRVAMEYARRHPDRVRTLTLKGVVPPMATMPGDFATNVDAALTAMLRDCATDAACRTAYPDLAGDVQRAAARLEAAPAMVVVDGRPLVLQRGLFGAVVRTMLQATTLRAELPRLLHTAASGNWQPFGERAAMLRRAAQSDVAAGLMLSVVCSEDVPFLDLAEARRQARHTLLGSYWLDQLAGGCAIWPRGAVPTDWHRPFRLAGPALLVSGGLDPATPPASAEAALASLGEARHIVVPGGSHSFAGMNGCVDLAMTRFVQTGRLEDIDAACAAKIVPPPFETAAPAR